MADLKSAHELITQLAKAGATREEADAVAQQKFGVTLDDVIQFDTDTRGGEIWGVPVPRSVVSGVVGYGQGLTSNWGDEARGRIKQAGAYLTGDDPDQAYEQELQDTRAMEESLMRTDPVPYWTGQVGGGVNQGLVIPGGAASKSGTLVANMGKGAALGAVQGAVAGAGAANGDLSTRARGAIVGTGTGAVAGGAMPLITRAGKAVLDKGKAFLQDMFQSPVNLAPAVSEGADAVAQSVQSRGQITVPRSDRGAAIDTLARNIDRDQLSPDQLQQAMTAMGPRGRLADIGPNLRDAADSVVNQPGAGKAIGTTALENRQLGQQRALIDAAETALTKGQRDGVNHMSSRFGAMPFNFATAKKLPTDFYEAADMLVQARKAASDPAYEAFRKANGGVTWSDDLAKLFERPALKRAWKFAQEIAGNEGIDLPKVAEVDPLTGDVVKWTGIPDNQTLDFIKRGLDDVIEGARDIKGKVATDSGRSVETVKNQFLRIVDDLNPQYKIAREAYSGPSQSIKALEQGRKFLADDAELTAKEIARMTKGDKEFFRIGVMREIADIIKTNPADRSVVNKLRGEGFKEKLAAAFDNKDAYARFVQEVENEARFASTRASTLGNSATARRLSAMGDTNANLAPIIEDAATGNTAGLARKAIGGIADFFTKDANPTEGARAVLADLLLRQGPEQIGELLPEIERRRLAQALMKQAGGAARYSATNQAAGAMGGATGPR